jgi:hypothetical protein
MEDPSGEIAKQGPLVFDFEIPVAEAPTYSVGQEVEAEGVIITLERVVDSPVLPQAVVCFEPPDAKHRWMPPLQPYPTYRSVQALLSFVGHYTAALLGKKEVWSAPQNLGDGCWSLQMDAPVEGHSSVTVEYLEGMDLGFKPKIIRGPWTFEFEVP